MAQLTDGRHTGAVDPIPSPPARLRHRAGGPRRPRRDRVAGWWDRHLAPYAYIAPFFVLFGIFGMFPAVYTAWVSLHDWQIVGESTFTGAANYVDLMGDPRFWQALRNTISIWVLSTVPQLLLALGLAHVLNNHRLRGRRILRIGLLVPNVTSVVAVAIIFESIFNTRYGIVNAGLSLFGVDPVNWRASTATSHIAISLMIIWRWTGYNAIIYLAGLQAIPRVLYEAAEVDGATAWQQFRHVTVPLLRPVITFTVIVSTIGGLQIFTEPLLFAEGPNITGGPARQFQTLALFLYEMGFRRFDFGYASAIAWILFLLIGAFSLINHRLTRGRARS